jgi:hypothetical protein
MDPDAEAEWNSLMEYDWSGGDNNAGNADAAAAAQTTTADEHLLDADFEEDDEPVILIPVPAPTPPPAASSSPQRSSEKVNENENSVTIESTDENYYPFWVLPTLNSLSNRISHRTVGTESVSRTNPEKTLSIPNPRNRSCPPNIISARPREPHLCRSKPLQ